MRPPIRSRSHLASWRPTALAAIVLSLAAAATGASAAASDPPGEPTVPATDATAIPGGVQPEILLEGTWFDDEGRLYFPENTGQSAEKVAAFCSFLFGTPEEVAAVFGLGELAFAEGSELVNLGGGGTGYSCGYVPADSDAVMVTDTTAGAGTEASEPVADTSGAGTEAGTEEVPLVVFVLLSQPLEIDGTPDGYAELFELDGGDDDYSGALGLSTEFDGEMIEAEFAEAWLTTARDRLA